MRATMIDAAEFARIVAEKELGFATIDELVDIADEGDVWTELFEEEGMRALKKSILRRVMRKNVKDQDGNRIEWVNIVQVTKGGSHKQVYKQLALLNIGEFEQLIRDRKGRVEKFEAEFRRFCRLAVKRFGKTIQKRFDFDLPLDD